MLWTILLCQVLALAETPAKKPPPAWTVDPHRILKIEHSRKSAGKLERWLFQGPIEQQRRILLAMARIGDPAFIESVNRVLNRSRNFELREAAAFALGSIEGETAFVFLSQHIPMHKDPKIVGALLIAAGRTGNPKAVHLLTPYLKPVYPVVIRNGAARGLGHAFTRLGGAAKAENATLPDSIGLLTDSQTALSGAFALARWQGDVSQIPVEPLVTAARQMAGGSARALVYRALGKVRSPHARDLLCGLHPESITVGERIEAVKSLGNQEWNDCTFQSLRSALATPSRHLQSTVMDAVQKIGAPASPLTPEIDGLLGGSGSEWVRSGALTSLIKIDRELARRRIQELLPKASGMVLEAIAANIARLGTPNDLLAVTDFLGSPHPRIVLRAMEGVGQLETGQLTPEIQQAVRNAVARGDAGVVSTASEVIEKHKLVGHLVTLTEIYPRFPSDDAAEIRAAIVKTVVTLGDRSHLPFLETALRDPHRIVFEGAAEGLGKITGTKPPVAINGSAAARLPSPAQLNGTGGRIVKIQTSRGDFSLKLFSDTPITNYYFLRELKKQVGRSFHRVVPNFVVQGGDPRGDGFGGPGYNIRDEITDRDHTRGVAGIATAGKDTGGCQFFVNTADNLHLIGRYTSFAEVISGIEVFDRLEPTDTILRVR